MYELLEKCDENTHYNFNSIMVKCQWHFTYYIKGLTVYKGFFMQCNGKKLTNAMLL